MKIVSWNVNGIRAVLKKSFIPFMEKSDADIYCLQETKIHDSDITAELQQIGGLKGYVSYWHGANKKGYSGVATITRIKPLRVIRGLGDPRFDSEGRILTLEFENFFLINAYVLNSQRGLFRLSERREFNVAFSHFLKQLSALKPLIFCGDLNVAHKEIDLANPKSNLRNAGFTQEERGDFDILLSEGFVDTFRLFDKSPGKYTWWSQIGNCRERNVGWRIDYFVVSKGIESKVASSIILHDVLGSDHCPIQLDVDLK